MLCINQSDALKYLCSHKFKYNDFHEIHNPVIPCVRVQCNNLTKKVSIQCNKLTKKLRITKNHIQRMKKYVFNDKEVVVNQITIFIMIWRIFTNRIW